MNMKKVILTIVSVFAFSLSAWAMDIDAAKEQGLIGETKSGYVAAVSESPSAEVTALVEEINAKRKKMYASIAKKRGAPLNSVEKLAAKKAYEKTQSGHFVKDAAGNWTKK